jgi:putative colanic acid biosynthesis acetyltransferase WcaF
MFSRSVDDHSSHRLGQKSSRNLYQDLSRFRLTEGWSRGRPQWVVQLWWVFDAMLVRPTPQAFYGWRRFALRLFGAKVGRSVVIRSGVRVTFPWKITIGDYCWIGDDATLYNLVDITIGAHSVISQGAYLCTGGHDYSDISFPVEMAPINVAPECWIAARAFIGPGVNIQHGAVVGACSVVLSDVPRATVVAGIPARKIGMRAQR